MTTLFTIEPDPSTCSPAAGRPSSCSTSTSPTCLWTIIETAYNLCDADEAIQAGKFAKLTLKRADVWSGPDGSLQISQLLSVSGEDPAFIKQVIDKYMDGFPDYLKKAGSGYFSRTAFPPDISLQPTDWNAEVHQT